MGARPALAAIVLLCLAFLAALGATAQPRLDPPGGAPPARPGILREPPQTPFLRVETGSHTAPVARLATDAAGRLLASVSDDKTLRLWSLPDGAPRGVLRPPIGFEEEGELYAVAMAPDGGRVFAAGFTGRAWDTTFAIYVFDTNTQRMVARLGDQPAPIEHLAISADGTRLAAGFGGRGGIRVWDARNGQKLYEDLAYGGPTRMVAFDAGNRLASSAADGRIRLYEPSGRKLVERVPMANGRPFGIAFSPDGGLLAVGYEDRLRVELLLLPDLRSVFTPDVTGLLGEGLPAVAWASDGRGGVQLYAAGYAQASIPAGAQAGASTGAPTGVSAGAAAQDRMFVIRRWPDFGLGLPGDIPAARREIAHLLPLPAGGLAFAASDPGWGRLAPDGTLAMAPQPAIADFRVTGGNLAIAADGTRLRFTLRAETPPLLFDAGTGRLEVADPNVATGFLAARSQTARINLQDWRNTVRPRLGNTALRLGEGEFSRSAAILPREDGFLLGTDNQLRLFDATGRPLDSLAMPGTVWGLAVAANGVIAAALGDGTLRWYEIQREGNTQKLAERGALFVHADGRRWVLWTPEGLFDHSPAGGQELVGVHLNGGRAQTPEWASFQQAYRALYAPLETHARIGGDPTRTRARLAELGDVRARVGRLPVLRASGGCVVLADGGCEALTWSPRLVIPADATAVRLSFASQDRGLGLGPLDVLVNERIAARGSPVSIPAGADPASGTRGGPGAVPEVSVDVPLDPGVNRIATRLYADDRSLFAEGPVMELRRAGDPAPPEGAGRLIVLAVGVNQYLPPNLPNLDYAIADADAVVGALRATAGNLFSAVDVIPLMGPAATRAAILTALDRVAATARPEDTFILYLAGHGVRTDADRRFLFIPSGVRDASSMQVLRPQALDDEALVGALARIRARNGLLFIDTCHAGQLALDSLAAIGNETGRFLLAASSSVQEALDSYDNRNGVFAFAVREGLQGEAADRQGRVSALSLGEFVTRRVPELALRRNHQQDAVFRTAQRDLRGFPLAQVAR